MTCMLSLSLDKVLIICEWLEEECERWVGLVLFCAWDCVVDGNGLIGLVFSFETVRNCSEEFETIGIAWFLALADDDFLFGLAILHESVEPYFAKHMIFTMLSAYLRRKHPIARSGPIADR